MSAYLFVTKPRYTPERVEEGFDVPWWSCSSTSQFGDHALVYVTGVGIQYEWCITSDAKRNAKWKYICDVEHFRTFDPPIELKEIMEVVNKEEWKPPYLHFRGYRSIAVPDNIAQRIRSLRSEQSKADRRILS
jgi:hypothetical protein